MTKGLVDAIAHDGEAPHKTIIKYYHPLEGLSPYIQDQGLWAIDNRPKIIQAYLAFRPFILNRLGESRMDGTPVSINTDAPTQAQRDMYAYWYW